MFRELRPLNVVKSSGCRKMKQVSRRIFVASRIGSLTNSYFRSQSVLQMPKKSKKSKVDSDVKSDTPAGPITAGSNGTVKIAILAKPSSKENAVTDINGEGVGVKIAAAPVDGAANSELCRYLAQVLGLRKSEVYLDKSTKSRSKVVVAENSTVEKVTAKLKEEMSNG